MPSKWDRTSDIKSNEKFTKYSFLHQEYILQKLDCLMRRYIILHLVVIREKEYIQCNVWNLRCFAITKLPNLCYQSCLALSKSLPEAFRKEGWKRNAAPSRPSKLTSYITDLEPESYQMGCASLPCGKAFRRALTTGFHFILLIIKIELSWLHSESTAIQ